LPSVRTVDIDPLVRLYGRFARSLRVFRGITGNAILMIIVPIFLLYLVPRYISLVWFGMFGTGWAALYVLLLLEYVNVYASIAACSTSAIRNTIALCVVLMLVKVGLALGVVLNAGSRWLVLVLVALGLALDFTLVGLVLHGLWPLLPSEHAEMRRIFASRLAESGRFRRSLAMLIRDLGRFAGMVIPPGRHPLGRIAVTAAITAFVLEGAVYWTYMELGWNVVKTARKVSMIGLDQWSKWSTRDEVLLLVVALSGPLIALALGRSFFAIARALRRIALRRSLRSADAARRDDSRPPVLFLRSFRDDQVKLSGARLPFQLRFFDPGTEAGTLEALLLRVMTPVGPVIAIGNPSDPIPPLGAARSYLADRQWQDVVRNLIREARLVVVGLDDTQGLRWELSEIAAQGAFEKTLVIVPPQLAGKGERAFGLLSEAGLVPTSIATRVGYVIAFLFVRGESVLALKSNGVSELEYDVALRLALTGLRSH
jgi:hypothetical protein